MNREKELMNENPVAFYLRFTPLFGIVAVTVGLVLSNYVVRTTQPNGLGEVFVPYGLTGLVLELVGIGLVVFGAVFNLSNLRSIGIRRAIISSTLISIGSTLSLLCGFGMLVDISELGQYSCSLGKQDIYPVCNFVLSQLLVLVISLGVGVLLLVIGLLPRVRRGRSDNIKTQR